MQTELEMRAHAIDGGLENELLDAQVLFSRFMGHLPGLAWIKDSEGRYRYLNDSAVAAFQKPREEILGKSDDEIFPPHVAAQFKSNDRQALESPDGIRVIESLEHDDGLVHHSLVSKFPIGSSEGKPAFVAGIAVDVTDRIWAEEKLQAMLQSIGDHLVCYDRKWRFTHVNDAVARTLEKTKEELIGHCIWDLFPAEVGKEYYRKLHEAAEKQEIVRYEHFYEPHQFWLENYIYPSKDGITVFSSNITWRRQMQEELENKAEALAVADRRKDEFLALLGHELRNPLAPLSNALELLKMTPGDPEAFERTRGIMERQVHQLTRLIDDLLDVSRITRGRLELRKQEMSLIDALQSAVEGSMPFIEQADLKLHIDVPAKPIWVHADRSRLAQVFTNLLNNAARYTQSPGNIWLTVSLGPESVEISVRDDGTGIAKENLGQIFDMFVQIERPGEPPQHGLGLGLTLVKELVELHGGTIVAHSDGPSKGSEFKVSLPLLEGASKRSDNRVQVKSPSGPMKRILVVDDNIDSALTMALLLKTMGHETHTAHDGKGALEAAEAYRPEIVLLDIGLPGFDGYEVARRIKASEWGKGAKVVAVTGWGQEEDKRKAAEAGFDLHLTKPVNPVDLEKILSS